MSIYGVELQKSDKIKLKKGVLYNNERVFYNNKYPDDVGFTKAKGKHHYNGEW